MVAACHGVTRRAGRRRRVAAAARVGALTAPVGPLLVVTAVEAEAEAVRAGLRPAEAEAVRAGLRPAGADVVAVGVGAPAAAAATARLLALAEAAGRPYHNVLCAGIAGGFPGRVRIGGVVLAARCVAADLGAQSPEGFLSLDELGFGATAVPVGPGLLAALRAALPSATVGDVLTVSTVTGTAEATAALAARHPAAVAEAMEGYGVACAAAGAGVPFAEIRTVSNPIGPRDRAAWRLPEALAALTEAAGCLGGLATVKS